MGAFQKSGIRKEGKVTLLCILYITGDTESTCNGLVNNKLKICTGLGSCNMCFYSHLSAMFFKSHILSDNIAWAPKAEEIALKVQNKGLETQVFMGSPVKE